MKGHLIIQNVFSVTSAFSEHVPTYLSIHFGNQTQYKANSCRERYGSHVYGAYSLVPILLEVTTDSLVCDLGVL